MKNTEIFEMGKMERITENGETLGIIRKTPVSERNDFKIPVNPELKKKTHEIRFNSAGTVWTLWASYYRLETAQRVLTDLTSKVYPKKINWKIIPITRG